jgi:hypothetical protein
MLMHARDPVPQLLTSSRHHVAVTYNSTTRTTKLYTNATMLSTYAAGGSAAHPSELGTLVVFWLGRSSFEAQYLNGQVQDLRFYDLTLRSVTRGISSSLPSTWNTDRY